MLAEIAAANAAFAVIKTAIQNGRQIADVAHKVGDYVNATEDARKKAEKRKRKSGGSDLEAFIQLEKLREQEEQLKQWMIYAGRAGLWQDWQRFQANARKARLAEQERRIKRRKQIFEVCLYSILFVLLGVGAIALVMWAWYLKGL